MSCISNSVEVSNENKFFMVLKSAMNLPGVKINREDFLEKELSKRFSREIVNLAIKKNPAYAGITVKQIEEIAKSCINYETNQATLLSTAAGIPGGFAMLGTIPADTVQCFGHILRILQKLVYLYGWSALYNSKGDFDDETVNQLTLFIGVMFGVTAATGAISKLAGSAAIKLEKSLVNKALTKGTIYPIVKVVAQKLGVKMNKQIFAKSIGKVVPLIGGVVSGGLTYATFKPSALRLEKHLKTLPTADVDFYKNSSKSNLSDDIIDAEIV